MGEESEGGGTYVAIWESGFLVIKTMKGKIRGEC